MARCSLDKESPIQAGCGKAARPDLCGGRSVMSVPTATFRNAAIEGAVVSQWVKNDRFAMSAQCPLSLQQRPDRRAALNGGMGH
jgi:hypothetical protein